MRIFWIRLFLAAACWTSAFAAVENSVEVPAQRMLSATEEASAYLAPGSAQTPQEAPKAQAETDITPQVLRGVPAGNKFPEVVRLDENDGHCSGTIVGPRAVLTAAHCDFNSPNFSFKGRTYEAKLHPNRPLYTGKKNVLGILDYDLAIAVTSKDIQGAHFASVGGQAASRKSVILVGYGCTNLIIRKATNIAYMAGTSITGFLGQDLLLQKYEGGVACYGDSGGPAFLIENNRHWLLGVISQSDMQENDVSKDFTLSTRLDIPESRTFLENFAQTHRIEICGINKNCP